MKCLSISIFTIRIFSITAGVISAAASPPIDACKEIAHQISGEIV